MKPSTLLPSLEELALLADEALVRHYANGCNEAFDTLLMRYKERTYGYIYAQVRNEDRANDIFQDTFIKVIACIRQGKYTENGKFAAWLGRITHNMVIDYFRQRKHDQLVWDDEYEGSIIGRMPLAADNPEESQINQRTLSEVLTLMEHLPEEQHKLVKQRIFEGLSFKSIAQSEGISINTALGRMRYALINMRKRANESNHSFYYY